MTTRRSLVSIFAGAVAAVVMTKRVAAISPTTIQIGDPVMFSSWKEALESGVFKNFPSPPHFPHFNQPYDVPLLIKRLRDTHHDVNEHLAKYSDGSIDLPTQTLWNEAADQIEYMRVLIHDLARQLPSPYTNGA